MRLAMPSGNQEPRRDPELKRKAWLAGFFCFSLFLGG
ncbi:YmiA family putative membrane protein, partial [Escherichia coli]